MSRANSGDIQLHRLLQQRERRFKLTFTQKSIVDKDTSLSIPNRLVHQRRSNSGIHSTRQTRYDSSLVTKSIANTLDLFPDNCIGRPITATPADGKEKIAQH